MVTIVAPDRQRTTRVRMSYEEYLALPDDGRRIEWIKGEAIYHQSPTVAHQEVVLFQFMLLSGYVQRLNLGHTLLGLFEVKFWPDGPAREPDVLFIGNEQLGQLTERRFEGGPDLVIEVISPGSITIDRVDKFCEYERAGVGEQWIIDPRAHQQQADFYIRDAAGRFAPAPLDGAGVFSSVVVPGFRLRVGWLWESPLPKTGRILTELLADAPGLSDELRAAYREMARLLSE